MTVFAERYGPLDQARDGSPIGDFLADLEGAVAEHVDVYPPTFNEIYSFEESKARFDSSQSKGEIERRRIDRAARYAESLTERAAAIRSLASFEWTPIESVFRKYHFDRNAEAMRQQRISTIESAAGFDRFLSPA